MDTIKEFIEGLDSVDRVGVGWPWSKLGADGIRIYENLACCFCAGFTLLMVLGVLLGLAVSISFIEAVLASG